MLQVRCARPADTGEPNCVSLCLPCEGEVSDGRRTSDGGVAPFAGDNSRNDNPSVRLRQPAPPCAPKRLFKPFRCSAWLIPYRQRTALSVGKRACSRFAARTLRVTSHRNDPSGHSGVAVGLFPQRVHSTLCSKTLDLQVRCAHPTGVFAPKCPFGTFRCGAWLI